MKKYCIAISSQTKDKNHIVILDIDKQIEMKQVFDFCHLISQNYNLSRLFVIKSTNGYNIYSLDKIPLKTIQLIGRQFYFLIDQDFIDLGYDRGYYALRVDTDKVLIWEYNNRSALLFPLSNAHRLFFNRLWGIRIVKSPEFDDFRKVQYVQYESEKNGKKI